jgi:hypothetical protein
VHLVRGQHQRSGFRKRSPIRAAVGPAKTARRTKHVVGGHQRLGVLTTGPRHAVLRPRISTAGDEDTNGCGEHGHRQRMRRWPASTPGSARRWLVAFTLVYDEQALVAQSVFTGRRRPALKRISPERNVHQHARIGQRRRGQQAQTVGTG